MYEYCARKRRLHKLVSHATNWKVGVRCAVRLICDCDQGEQPIVPDSVNSASKQCRAAGEQDPVASLTHGLFAIITLENDIMTTHGVAGKRLHSLTTFTVF